MIIEVAHLDATILSLKADGCFTVGNLKDVISQNIHIPTTALTLACNGSLLEDEQSFAECSNGDLCKVLLFLPKGESIRTNIEVDFGHGKVIFISVCLKWTVAELKQRLQKVEKNDHLGKTDFLTFAHYIMEDDRKLEEYKIKEGSRLTVFTYLSRPYAKEKNGKITGHQNEPEESPQTGPHSEDSHNLDMPEKEALKSFPKFETYEDRSDDINEYSPAYSVPMPPTPSPQATMPEQSRDETITSRNMPTISRAEQSAMPSVSEPSLSWNTQSLPVEIPQQGASANGSNGFNGSGAWPGSMGPKTIVIPGGFRRQAKPSFAKSFPFSPAVMDRSKGADKMEVIFTDGTRKMNVELPTTVTVYDALEAVKLRISDGDKDRIRLFKGYVQMEGHHPLSQYGVVPGSTVVFKKTGPLKKF